MSAYELGKLIGRGLGLVLIVTILAAAVYRIVMLVKYLKNKKEK